MGISWQYHGSCNMYIYIYDIQLLQHQQYDMSVFENGGPPYLDDYFIGKKMTEYDKPFYFGVPISRQPMSNPG
jgi:hypothetical protein